MLTGIGFTSTLQGSISHDGRVASIRQRRRKDGSTYYSVLWRDRGRQTSISVNRREDADYIRAHLNLTGSLPRALQAPGPSVTVAELVQQHIDGLSGVQAFTISKYRALAALHIEPTLGAMPAGQVTREVVGKWADSLDRAPKTVKDVHALLSAAYTSGERNGLVATNPARGVRLPVRVGRDAPELLTRGEFETIMRHMAPKWRPLFRLLAQTGMRWGEAAALTARDVDVRRATISITKAVKRQDGGPNVIGPTKTRRSRRVVSVPASLLVELAPLLQSRGRIFADLTGDRLRSDSALDAWRSAIARARSVEGDEVVSGEPTMRDLRHSHASWLLEAGVNPRVVQERLGHEKVATTMEIYARVSRDADAAAAALLDGLG